MRYLRLLLIVVIPGCLNLDFEEEQTDLGLDPASLNILFIGNSLTFTNDLPNMLGALIDSADQGPVDVRWKTEPNLGLQDHWVRGEVLPMIEGGGWDFVIMQQGPSATEGRPSLLEYSKRFGDAIRASGAEPALYMVWPADDRAFDWDGVRESYAMAADSAMGLFLPAGEGWRVAWEADSTLPFYSTDGFHPTVLGTYMAALVIFERLTGETPIGLPDRFQMKSGPTVSITPARAVILQNAAREVNERESR
jgi:hypothetical protein